jgi:hypothetical protein
MSYEDWPVAIRLLRTHAEEIDCCMFNLEFDEGDLNEVTFECQNCGMLISSTIPDDLSS